MFSVSVKDYVRKAFASGRSQSKGFYEMSINKIMESVDTGMHQPVKNTNKN